MDPVKYFWAGMPLDEEEEEEEPFADEDVQMQTEDEEEGGAPEEDIRYENEDVLLPASLCPPAHGHGCDSSTGSVLLEYAAYFADRRNATTASCEMRDGMGGIHVTFCTAAPPQVSYFCIHYSGTLKLSHFAAEPQVLASAGGLALLRVPLGDESDSLDSNICHYFIYHAGTMGQSPTLTQLPHPRPYQLLDRHTAIVRHCPNRHCHHALMLGLHGASNQHDCSDCTYTIASLCPAHTQQSDQYNLILLSRDTMAWSCDTILIDKETAGSRFCATNTINIGGKKSTVGWVDLWRGILFCDVLAADGRRKLRYVPLPPPLVEKAGFWLGDPSVCRDIAVVNGFIKCVNLQVRVVPGSSTFEGGFTSDGWSVAIWSIKITAALSQKWKLDHELDSTELCDSLPNLKVDAGTAQPTLRRLHVGQPILSLEAGDIVYFLTKIDYRDDKHNGWVFAVDIVKKKIRGVAEFGCQRTLGLGLVFAASEISQYLKDTPHGGAPTEMVIPSWAQSEERPIDYSVLFK